ncbi:hypothetical protein F2Q69_00056777 [Brassica cretica]|uniref:SHSP domain-containing protein n=1 Tax=Brassica cretica TaxID=69181 RepID=A0A8S9MWI7_BRACR|nr:hypothetical protein F2Q69_00056777 [Brassica cretica]
MAIMMNEKTVLVGEEEKELRRMKRRRKKNREDPELTGQTVQPHPGLTQGPASDYEYKQLLEGSVYVRLDMPGVSEDNVNINIDE